MRSHHREDIFDHSILPMRNLILSFAFGCFVFPVMAQDGLEGIIVEKYYTSGPGDTKAVNKSGELEEGSVTYRIFVDLKPGYRFQAAYGSPVHPLIIHSTEPFYNHTSAGTTHANILPERTLSQDISLLDSWLSVGAAGENHLGIPKIYDDNNADEFVKWNAGFLEHAEGKDFVPIRERDGLVRANRLPFPTFYQMDSCLKVLGNSTNGGELRLDNGAWACMGKGAVGADSLTTNTVLIAQLTTAGELSFELNIQVATPHGNTIRYVARNPEPKEMTHPDLIYVSKEKLSKKKRKADKKKTKPS